MGAEAGWGGPAPWSPGSLPFGLSRVRARLRCCRRLVPLDSSRICYTDSFQVSAVPLSGPLVPVRAGCSSSVSVLSFRLCGSSWRCFRSASLPGLPPLPHLYGVGGVLWWGCLFLRGILVNGRVKFGRTFCRYPPAVNDVGSIKEKINNALNGF